MRAEIADAMMEVALEGQGSEECVRLVQGCTVAVAQLHAEDAEARAVGREGTPTSGSPLPEQSGERDEL